MSELRKNLKWAAVFLLVITVSLLVIFIHARLSSGAKHARVISDGEVIRTVNLENVGEPYEFEVVSPDGGHNTVRVEKGKIAVVSADCPDKLCVRQGFTDSAAMPIVCLPNKLSVVVSSEDGEVDAVTGGLP